MKQMLIPTKHEKLNRNILVLGADIINQLKIGDVNVEELFQNIKESKDISLDEFLNSLLFLWMSNLIVYNDHNVKIIK